jgi:hypothetical protein
MSHELDRSLASALPPRLAPEPKLREIVLSRAHDPMFEKLNYCMRRNVSGSMLIGSVHSDGIKHPAILCWLNSNVHFQAVVQIIYLEIDHRLWTSLP